jgi:phytoene dehydrogenase-like protein
MARSRTVIVIGAGHNGLITAAYLARAGLRPLVLEARDTIGGRAVTEEIHPGFRCPTLAHTAGPLLPAVAHDLALSQHGLEWLTPEVRVFAPTLDGPALVLHNDPARTAADLRALSAPDAEAYPEFAASLTRIGGALSRLVSMTPPNTEDVGGRDLWNLLQLGRKLRGLGKKDTYRMLRWGPMAVADFAAEWFEHDLLRAVIAARGIYASFAGPRSAGTTAGILLQAASDGHATAPAVFPRGGMGALSHALASAARAAGAQIRTGARVAHVMIKNGSAGGVVLEDGEEIPAAAVVSSADPHHTYLGLVDAAALGPDFVGKIRNYRCQGAAAKVNLALSRLPRWKGRAPMGSNDGGSVLSGRIHIGPSVDYLERAFDAAKYGELSPRPYLDISIPTLLDPGLTPEGGHVMSIHAQFVPYAPGTDGRARNGHGSNGRGQAGNGASPADRQRQREEVARVVIDTLAEYAPDLPKVVLGQKVLTPADLESEYSLSGGHLLHGEPALDQLFAFRPLVGWAQYRSPIRHLYLCGSGTHPGGAGAINGASGANASREILRDLR